nr:hypothetical protein [uncultured bacterium]
MNLAYLQVPLLESYLQSPLVHVAASNNPELRGGYFINIPEDRTDEVRDLLDGIKRDRAHILRFAEAIAAGQELLRANATGFDLRPFTRSSRQNSATWPSWPTTPATRRRCVSPNPSSTPATSTRSRPAGMVLVIAFPATCHSTCEAYSHVGFTAFLG